jgi:hypothetical protein
MMKQSKNPRPGSGSVRTKAVEILKMGMEEKSLIGEWLGPESNGLVLHTYMSKSGSALWIAGVDHPPPSLSDPTYQLECMQEI